VIETASFLISAAAVVMGAVCWFDPYMARLAAALLRAHAAATVAARKERKKVWERCMKAAAVRAE
jgi:hypothetical protein